MGERGRGRAGGSDAAAPGRLVDAKRRPGGPPFRASGPSAGDHAVPAARLSRSDLVSAVETLRERAMRAAAGVVDPELPVLTIADLGVLRGVSVEGDAVVV